MLSSKTARVTQWDLVSRKKKMNLSYIRWPISLLYHQVRRDQDTGNGSVAVRSECDLGHWLLLGGFHCSGMLPLAGVGGGGSLLCSGISFFFWERAITNSLLTKCQRRRDLFWALYIPALKNPHSCSVRLASVHIKNKNEQVWWRWMAVSASSKQQVARPGCKLRPLEYVDFNWNRQS